MMALKVAAPMPANNNRRLSAALWIAAGTEIAVAAAVATLILHADHTMHASDMQQPQRPEISWNGGLFIIAGFCVAMLIWWFITRARLPAILVAAGLIGLCTSGPVRAMAVDSHLVAMAALEALLVAVPLLLVTALGNRLPTKGSGHSLTWTAAVIIAVALNSALLIAVHLPGVRGHAAHLGIVPMWLPAVVVTIGLGYWAAVVLSAGRLPSSVRRAGLIVGQEVAAILGLAALLRPDSHMHGHTAFGLPASMDQRLGGLLMLAACAAVTLPLANRLTQQQAIRQTRMERHVN